MQPGRALWKASDAAWLQTPHVHLSSLSTSPPPHTRPPPPPPPTPFSLSGLAVCIISTSFHYYDNTLWGLKAIETLRETGNFMPLWKFIYFLSPSVDGGREGREGGGQLNLLFGPLFFPSAMMLTPRSTELNLLHPWVMTRWLTITEQQGPDKYTVCESDKYTVCIYLCISVSISSLLKAFLTFNSNLVNKN